MVRKLIVIGIDGMDYDVVRRHEDVLPNISGIMKEHACPRLRSVFPADTTPAAPAVPVAIAAATPATPVDHPAAAAYAAGHAARAAERRRATASFRSRARFLLTPAARYPFRAATSTPKPSPSATATF